MKKALVEHPSCEIRKQPFFHLTKRGQLTPWQSFYIHALALLGALTTGALLLLCLGYNPLLIYAGMLKGALGTATASRETVKMSVPLIFTGIGIALAFKMKFWNIGGEGQILMGGIAATGVLVYLPNLPYLLRMGTMAVAAICIGGLFGAIPAVFKTRWGTNETLFTLMLNYVALQLVRFLQYQASWQDPGTRFPKIFSFGAANTLPKLFGVHIGWVVALLTVVLASLYLKKSKHGYEIAVVGDSLNTARYAGMNVNKVQIRTLFISAGLCGLAGFFQVAGADGTLTESTAGGVGFTAITVAWLAKLKPSLMVAVAFFIAILQKGSVSIQSTYQIPASAADLLIGLLLFFMLGGEFFSNYKLMRRGASPSAASKEQNA